MRYSYLLLSLFLTTPISATPFERQMLNDISRVFPQAAQRLNGSDSSTLLDNILEAPPGVLSCEHLAEGGVLGIVTSLFYFVPRALSCYIVRWCSAGVRGVLPESLFIFGMLSVIGYKLSYDRCIRRHSQQKKTLASFLGYEWKREKVD